MINNKANRKGKDRKERERERETEREREPVTSEKSNLVIFKNHIFSAYILH